MGFADEVTDDALLRRVSDQVLGERIAPERGLVFDRVFVADESLMLTTPELLWLDEQARRQRAIVDDVLGQREWGWLWAHLSLATFTAPKTRRRSPTPSVRTWTPWAPGSRSTRH